MVGVHVLFVCTGNICRSPTAERLALAYCAELDIGGVTVSSAGTRALIGRPMQREAARVLESLGGDPSLFAARQLTAKIASSADLLLTMTRSHRDAVLELAPHQFSKTFVISEVVASITLYDASTISEVHDCRPRLPGQSVTDIADPIGQGSEFYALVGSQIAELLPPVLELCRNSE